MLLPSPFFMSQDHGAWDHYTISDSDQITGSSEVVASNGSYTISANRLIEGSIIEYEATFRIDAVNGSDTFRGRIRIGAEVLGGTVLYDSGAIATPAAGDYAIVSGRVYVRTQGASASMVGRVFAGHKFAGSVIAMTHARTAAFTQDGTSPILIGATGQWSSAHADNDARLENMRVKLWNV